MHVFCSYIHSMNHTYAYSRDDRKIKFRMVSAQHFINEAPELLIQNCSSVEKKHCVVECSGFTLTGLLLAC